MRDSFRRFANGVADRVGSPWSFLWGIAVVLAWGITGPLFHYSDTWQLVINTGTSVITFLMVFLIQNTQNRDARAMQLKLNELIRSTAAARNSVMDLENCTDEEIAELKDEFVKLRKKISSRKHGEAEVTHGNAAS